MSVRAGKCSACGGELVQIRGEADTDDRTYHPWNEQRGDDCRLARSVEVLGKRYVLSDVPDEAFVPQNP